MSDSKWNAAKWPNFVVMRCGPMCAACAATLKRAFESGEIASFAQGQALAQSLHVECTTGVLFDITIEEVRPNLAVC